MIRDLTLRAGQCARFISDIHLGHPKAKAEDPASLSFLLEGCTHLIVCGDLSETRESVFKADALDKRDRFRQMCRDAGVELIQLDGNHDPDEPLSLLRMFDGRLCALHGHAIFKEVAPWGREYMNNKTACKALIASYPNADTDLMSRFKLARAMSVIVPPIYSIRKDGQEESAGKTGPAKLWRFLRHAAWPPERPIMIIWSWLTMNRKMRCFAERFLPNARTIIYGHMHRRVKSFSKRKANCINLGACFRNANSCAVDVFPDGKLCLRNYSVSGFVGVAHSLKSQLV